MMRLFFIILCTLISVTSASPVSLVTADGAWCWFTEPRAVSWQGKTYTGWVNRAGDIVAAAIDSATHSVDTVILHSKIQIDDHANPSFLMWPDGRLYCFYSTHADTYMRLRVMQKPGDLHSLGAETFISDPAGGYRYSYPCPFMLPAEDSALYVFVRDGNWKPSYTVSRDRGITWEPLRNFFLCSGQTYFKIKGNDKDRFDIILTDGHPENTVTSVYYAYYKAGALFKANGTRIKSMDSLPLRPAEAEKVYDPTTNNNVRSWIWDLALDGEGKPIMAYVNFPSSTDHRYRYARFDGTRWLHQELCKAGKWFVETKAGETESEPYYSGGISLDHANPFNLYLSRPDSTTGVFGIEQWTSSDSGTTWRTRVVVKGKDTLNVRPVVPRGGGAGVEVMYMTGKYSAYTSYNTSIRMTIKSDSTLISDIDESRQQPFNLYLTAFPNPFNPQVIFDVKLPSVNGGDPRLIIVGMDGRIVWERQAVKAIGKARLIWNGLDRNDRPAAPGVYLARLLFDGKAMQTRVVLAR